MCKGPAQSHRASCQQASHLVPHSSVTTWKFFIFEQGGHALCSQSCVQSIKGSPTSGPLTHLGGGEAFRKKKVQGISGNAAEKVGKGQMVNMVQFKLRQLDFILEPMGFQP